LKFIIFTILSIIIAFSDGRKQTEDRNVNELLQSLKIDSATRIEIVIFPVRTSELTIHGKSLENAEEIQRIRKFVSNNETITEVIKFQTLPDGYLALYNDSVHLKNIYFSFDKTTTYLQLLGKDISKEIKLNPDGNAFFREIYESTKNKKEIINNAP